VHRADDLHGIAELVPAPLLMDIGRVEAHVVGGAVASDDRFCFELLRQFSFLQLTFEHSGPPPHRSLLLMRRSFWCFRG